MRRRSDGVADQAPRCRSTAAPWGKHFSPATQSRQGISRAIGHVRADLIARYNKDEAWEGRRDAFTRVSDHVATLIGAREGAAVIALRG
jgi:kynureninase